MEDITIHYWFMIGITSQDDIDIEDGSVYLMGAGSELLELVISVAGVASVSVDISAASPVSIAGTGSWFVSVSATLRSQVLSVTFLWHKRSTPVQCTQYGART